VSYQPPYDALPPPGDRAEAERRATFFRERDPYPEIFPALLCAEHIANYVRVTGMLDPFYPESDRLKPASYEAKPSMFIRWDEDGRKTISRITPNTKYVFKANYITFALIDSKIMLPNYIGLRFNFRIKHVHRGLLLGTGPLIDPGFRGNLLIPVHNLTSDDYEIGGDEGLIWIEFTKTSRRSDASTQKVELEPHKRDVGFETYFERASGNNPIRSSIPQFIRDARERANQAERSARRAQRTVQLFAGIGIVAIAGAAVAVDVGLHSYFGQMTSLADSVQKDASQAGADAKRALDERGDLKKALDAANQRIESLEADVRRNSMDLQRQRQQRARVRP
jgi:deoxycytidine triphosphate deaminase